MLQHFLIWLSYLNGHMLINTYIIIVHYGRIIINPCILCSVLSSGEMHQLSVFHKPPNAYMRKQNISASQLTYQVLLAVSRCFLLEWLSKYLEIVNIQPYTKGAWFFLGGEGGRRLYIPVHWKMRYLGSKVLLMLN